MEPYWHGNAACNKYLSYLEQLCTKLRDVSHCDVIQIQLKQEYSELEYYNHLLLSQHSSTRPERRQRRGLINGVGYLANTLFGVLDERFADQYKQDIQVIQYNENHLVSLMKNQTSIIEAQYNVLKRNEISINKQHKLLNLLSMKLNKLRNSVKNQSEQNQIMYDFSLGAIATSNILRNLKTIQNTLLDTITDVYHGRLNFHLLSPDQLKDTLNKISSIKRSILAG
ncbi:unnamed protein product [Leptidea sinapis]|uniref:Uncharacterized protein n=1 Tax=Leptidea sinapis TaxID=189913 RepID=A0A5E4QRY4_9NEOP|nr:unnamed protein product [Leptidea sinapis]